MSESWGPRERQRYLDTLDGTDGLATLLHDIGDAERLVARAEADWDDAVAALRNAAADAPDADLAADRELTPASRHQLVTLYQTQDHETRAAAAYHRARARLNALLATLDDLSRPDLGLPPGPGPDW